MADLKNTRPLISVVMPNYNGAKFIEETIHSVLKQTYSNFELIIIDDGSSDNSVSIVEQYSLSDSRITLIVNENNQGVSFSRNTGIMKSKGEFIALIDSDDTWEPDKLERQLKIAKSGADLVFCSYDFIDERSTKIKKPFIVPNEATFNSMLSSSAISCSTAFIKSELLKSHLFKSEYYHEDYVLWMELLQLPIRAEGDKKVLMHYRQSSGSRSSQKINTAKERWKTYRYALKLSLPLSIWSFIRYSINGVVKYYF